MKRVYTFSVCLLLLLLPLLMHDTPNVVGQGNGTTVHLPIIFGKDYELTITQVILTQATQTTNNAVPLVKGRRTIARVFVGLASAPEPSEVIVSLSATRNGASIGSIIAPPRALPANPSRDNLASTFNFELPADWLDGTVQITAAASGVARDNQPVSRANELQTTVTFYAVPDLDVKIIPLNYNHTGPTNPGNYFTGNIDHISTYLYRTYPIANVNISFRAAYNYTGNLEYTGNINQHGQIWSDLLDEMESVKIFENAPASQVYYTNVPVSANGRTWFSSGIAGIGYIGERVSVALDLGNNDSTGSLGAHEIGHNFGRRHAPCGGAAGTDPAYPYPDAQIGVHGFDIVQNRLYLPQSSVRDLMSYCDPQWISDYTYRALFDDQRANGLRAGEIGDVLLVRVRLDGGAAEILPLYQFEGRISAETPHDTYQLQYLNAQGEVVATDNLRLLEAIEEDVAHRSIVMSVPQIDLPFASVRLLINGREAASRALNMAAREAATVERVGNTIRVTWSDADIAQTIRVSNGDETYTLVGLDITGGAFEFDAGDLRDLGRVEVISALSNIADTIKSGR